MKFKIKKVLSQRILRRFKTITLTFIGVFIIQFLADKTLKATSNQEELPSVEDEYQDY